MTKKVVRTKLTDDAFVNRVRNLTKRHSADWALLVFDGCVGRSIKEVARLSGRDQSWVQERLDEYAMIEAAGGIPGEGDRGTVPLVGRQDQRREIVKTFAPAKPCAEYVEDYEEQGMEPAVAARLAKAYEATEKALDKGVIKESRDKEKNRFFEVALNPASEWNLKLNNICSDIRSAASALDDAKVNDLKRRETHDRVVAAFEKLEEQIERIHNFHNKHSEV
jgi:hypothetical protein